MVSHRIEISGIQEWEALVYLCKLGLKNHFMPPGESLDFQKIDWENILRLADKHRVGPLLNIGVSLLKNREKIPDEIVERLKKHHSQRSRENLLNARELIHLIKAMNEKGMEVVPYKGVVLAQLAYNNIGLREMSDIDFLMKLDEFSVIREILLKRGYVPSKIVPEEFEAMFFRQNFQYNFDLYRGTYRQFHVEPHWKIGLKQWQTDLDFVAILPLTSKRDFFGTEINMLTPEGLLITTCLHHGGEDRWNSLKYICDVAAILFKFEKDLNWSMVLRETGKFKVTNLILLGIGVAVNTFEVPLPDEIRQLIAKKKIRTHVQKVISQFRSGVRSANINSYFKHIGFHFSLRKSLLTKLKVFYYHFIRIFTPTIYDINDKKSAGKKYWWLFITKPFRIWRTHVKTK
ncbi:MAG: nucleotidyltransferase family protein [Roseivirga sp.]|nr:nucleotidyltransferase family protein [Roseivirga sp.]